MEMCQVRDVVEKSYGIKPLDIEKIKNVYKIKTSEKNYCLKLVKYELPHCLFILNAIKHLKRKGFNNVLDIIPAGDGLDYIKFGSYFACLTEWVQARECNYDNPLDLIIAASTLANLHNKSTGFVVTNNMRPRVQWLKWPGIFETRINEILDFKKRIEAKSILTEFDNLYISMMEEEIKRAEKAREDLLKSNYITKMKKEILNRGFCHHDFAHHNVLIGKGGKVYIIDFDYCTLDTHLHDLCSLLIRRMKNGKWDVENAEFILDAYSVIKPVHQEDIAIMAAFMEFPQDYWQIGIQYYWEKQPWGEEFFENKLKKNYIDRQQKQEFVEDFMVLKYGG
ncbi:MAG: CotS family spore coat protein [Bacillota bacterium]|nr:CotS family spore coat protein [Bacillota bacterium]